MPILGILVTLGARAALFIVLRKPYYTHRLAVGYARQPCL
jgi:hypothetical protein